MKRFSFSFWRFFWCHKYLWTFLFFVLIVGFLDPNSYWNYYQLKRNNNLLREQIAVLDNQYRNDNMALHDFETSQEAVENVARVRLFMKTDREDLYIIEER